MTYKDLFLGVHPAYINRHTAHTRPQKHMHKTTHVRQIALGRGVEGLDDLRAETDVRRSHSYNTTN